MAKKTDPKKILERTYIIPLRREWLKAPKYRRAKRATTAVRSFLVKHMKSDSIKIGPFLNQEIWKRGIKSPPHKIKVTAVKDEKGTVQAELFGVPEKKVKKEELPKAGPHTEKREEISETAKKVEAEELKAIKLEQPPHPKIETRERRQPAAKPAATTQRAD
ncbi:MAG TPA: 50S ribosomal protein L31e [Candidatus Nanoarchaeia archaeon]|nr:50S ribosomal protein L31e [Candidatus Nanoarchaeia archaeon]